MTQQSIKELEAILTDFQYYLEGKKNPDGTDWDGDYPTTIGKLQRHFSAHLQAIRGRLPKEKELPNDDWQEHERLEAYNQALSDCKEVLQSDE